MFGRNLRTSGGWAASLPTSLTVADVAPGWFSVALIPHTLAVTNLRAAGPGDPVNLETDVIAKYVERLLAPHRAA